MKCRGIISNRFVVSLMLLLVVYSMSSSVYANPARGLEIAKERKERDKGWQDSTASVEMILSSATGEESTRLIRIKSLEVEGDGDKGLTVFDEPRDVKGTVFLTYSHINVADDQWLYLPALKKIKRISSRNKSGPFMGSEFSYEDLSSFELEKYNFAYLKDDLVEGVDCFLIEQVPVDSQSGYTRQLVWLDKAEYRPVKVEYYDRKKSLLKTLVLTEYKQYLDKYWRAHELTMSNHQTGKRTVLRTSDIQFKTGLTENDFNQSTMGRVK